MPIALPDFPTRAPRTAAEVACYNQGVTDVLDVLRRAATAVNAIGKRPINEGFSAAALEEMWLAGRLLLIGSDAEPAPDSQPSVTA